MAKNIQLSLSLTMYFSHKLMDQLKALFRRVRPTSRSRYVVQPCTLLSKFQYVHSSEYLPRSARSVTTKRSQSHSRTRTANIRCLDGAVSKTYMADLVRRKVDLATITGNRRRCRERQAAVLHASTPFSGSSHLIKPLTSIRERLG